MMRKQLIVFGGLFIAILMNAMDKPISSESVAPPGICYLALMLPEIQNHIASFLVGERETKKEFVERTKNFIKIPEDYFKFAMPKTPTSAEQSYALKGRRAPIIYDMGALNPDQTFFALLKTRIGSVPFLTINDLQKKEDEEERIRYAGEVHCKNYKVIALSPHASMIAYIEWILYGEGVMGERLFMCQVQKVNSPDKTIRTFDIPKTFLPALVAFNKQCTRIILHREIIDSKERDDSDHILFSLKLCALEVMEKKKLPPLQKHLRNRYICASLESSK